MTQSNGHHRRTPSGSNVPKLRTSRPSLHRKGTSFVNHSISKLGSGQTTKHFEVEDDRQPEMSASFLNFCAMCEKQITVPDNSLLYCSEGCRRKDSHKPLSASFSSTSSMSSTTTPPTSPPMSPRIIVAPRTPTKAPSRYSVSARITGEWNDAKTDQDPSEWKPVIPMGSGVSPLASSEAWNYLSQFHSDESVVPMRRPRLDHRSSSLTTLLSAPGPIPSLMHTPSTAASSFSSNGSDCMSYMHDAAYRPLPPRHNPYFPSCSTATKGVDLVVPHVHIPTEDATPVDMSNEDSIFPASSALWDDKRLDKTPTLATTLGSVNADVPARPLEASS
ncbi:hypothetical protein BO70DRAFT_392274 [Aspergillus heteromorphus CBS 117.55]|uniref:Life-span regulatory factor-domain-containing protein n=1 Tax=Aspergillus heteromorphus CBS 117.55 TaxID=1448321 RepID=A0A317X3Z5_9EURO|nr:uncharacterized protein BO70DRAFT_392274 [Aspergillus heteromorphus CBS 117.55]PWY92901.1 hypothetical protein BO70DRAFT_392274 [Aspergillus heteromorphus CBS 117.55]